MREENHAPPLHQRATVRRSQALGRNAYRLQLSVPRFPPALPGQFLMLRATEGDDPLLPRAMAIYRVRRARGSVALEVIYRVEGRGTALLAALSPGEPLWMLGPLGRSFPLPPPGARPLLVGGGTGIASLYFLAQHLRSRRASNNAKGREALSVLIGARTEGELLCRADFRALGARVHLSTDDGSRGDRGPVTDLLERLVAEAHRRGRAFDIAYVCGPTPMMEAAWAVCERAGIACQVSLEGPMACGFGVCLGCAVPRKVADPSAPILSPRDRVKLVCTDGPVFDAAELAWGWDA
jgi:dihydroorotate dehydrogenase electron transfer subunit